ncbi:MAG TPA: hypothetical protein VN622_15870 [Clostridia bacterium]|nr:hypothetical protein [Clostridia bacterium]
MLKLCASGVSEHRNGANLARAGKRLVATAVVISTLLVGGAFASPELGTGKAEPSAPIKERSTEPTFTITAGLDGEIFPVFANYASLRKPRDRQWGTVSVRVTNSTDKLLKARITVQVPGWSDQEIQLVELAAGVSRAYLFAPSFLPRLYRNKEIVAATALVSVTDMAGKPLSSETVPVRLRSAGDMYWGRDFKYASFIASWVTPHDPKVEQVLSAAKEMTPKRRLPGYEASRSVAAQERSTYTQARAIYRALQQKGISYVKSSLTFGGHQDVSERVRMPGESLHQVSANCIDGAVMYASLFENLGMDPVVVLVPGHAYVGVRVAKRADKYLFLETSLTGRATFEQAVKSATLGLARVAPADIIRIGISEARLDGIYPMPSPAHTMDSPEAVPVQLGSKKARP